jgi:UDP-glucose 4-epimerase
LKVLVTGGAGFIGSHVVDLYLEGGYEVVVVDDLSTGREINLNPQATFYKIDIRSQELARIFELEKPDYVNHHAAQMDVRYSVEHPIFDADVNILGSLNLLECARRYEVRRFVYISSGGAVYGEPIHLPCDEEHPIAPISPYGASKYAVEQYLYMYYLNYGLEYAVLRYANVYGPRQNPQGEAGVVAIFTNQMLAGRQAIINGDGKQERDFVYVKDCAKANLLATTSGVPNGVYNLGNSKGTSINQLFFALKKLTGYQAGPFHGPAKLGETRRIYLNAEKARRQLGWAPATELEAGLEETVAYYREPVG